FWQTTTVKTVNDEEQQITVTVDGQTIVITEASVRRHLQLADADGISSLPNTEIFEQLALIGYVSNDDKLTFQKGEHIPLFDLMLIHDQPGQGEGPTLTVESQHILIASPTTSQPTTSQPMSSQEQPSQVPTTKPIITTLSRPLYETIIPHTTSSMPHDSPLSGGDIPGSDDGSKKLNELTKLCTKLSDKVTSLKEDLKQTKKVYGKALTKLVKKVKHLEAKLKSTSVRRKTRMVISDDKEDLVSDDPSKQGRMTETEYEDVDVETEYEEVEYELDQSDTFQQITPTKVSQGEEQSLESSEVQLDVLSATKILADASRERSDTIKRYQTLKKKPVSVAHVRKNMMIYLKNMAEYKMGYFKGMSYDEIRPMFEKEYNKIQILFKKDTEVEKTKTKRVAEETLLQESFKKLRTAEASSLEPIQEQPIKEPKELSEEELKKMLEIVPVEEIKAEALQVKLFEPDKDDVLWKLQKYMHDPLTWRLYDTYGVHRVSSTRGYYTYMLTEKDYPLSTTVMGLMLSRRLQVEEDSEMARDPVMKIFIEANKPRS
ncbi:hypothetical protein Tco_0360343, partial [Tanacetum coccineum]